MSEALSKSKQSIPATQIKVQESAAVDLDRSTFMDLALPLAQRLYATAYRMCRNADRAEDLVQETFLRAWHKFDRFESGTNFRAWIFQILTYLYLNERRRMQSSEVTVDFSDQEPVAGQTDLGQGINWDAYAQLEVEDEVKSALERLNDEQRVVFLMVTLGELSYQECADALNLPIGTIMSRLFRARRQLKEELTVHARERGFIRGGS